MITGKGDSVLQVMVACEKASGLTIKREDAPRRAGDPAVVSSLAQSPSLLVHSGVMLSRWLVVAVNLRPEPCEHDLEVEAGVRLGHHGRDGVEVALDAPDRLRWQPTMISTTGKQLTVYLDKTAQTY